MTDGRADAELEVRVNDQTAGALKRMRANVNTVMRSMGANAAQVTKAQEAATKAVQKHAAAAHAASGVMRADNTAMLRRREVIRGLRNEVTQLTRAQTALSRAATATQVGTGLRGAPIYRGTDGKFVSAAQVAEYNRLGNQIAATQTRIQALYRASAQASQASAAQQIAATRAVATAQVTAASAAAAHAANFPAGGLPGATPAATRLTASSLFGKQGLAALERGVTEMYGVSNAMRYVAYDVSRNAAVAGVALGALGIASIAFAAKWEHAFASVARTTGANDVVLEQLRAGLKSMSQDLPVSFTDLTEIASVGAQMGIATDGIVQYTEVVAKLTATTNLSADAASQALGRFKAFYAEAEDPSLAVTNDHFTNLASSILKVGVNSVATESGIVNVATQISSMGSYAGLTADQTIGLAGALSSVKVAPELSRGVITRLFNTLGVAVANGGENLATFAELAGVSSDEFKAAWGTENFGYILTDMIQGLGELHRGGGDAVRTLHELGITSVRDVPVLIRLANAAGEAGIAGGLLAQTMNDARSGWRDNIELQLQYQKVSQTLVSRLQVLGQNFEALFATLGESSTTILNPIIDTLSQVVKGFTALTETPVMQFLGPVIVGASLLGAGLLLLTSGLALAGGAAIGVSKGLDAMGLSAARAAGFVRILGFAIGGLTVVGLLATVITGFVSLAAGANEANNAIADTQGLIAAMQDDAANQSGFIVETNAGDAAKEASELSTQAQNLAGVLPDTEDRLYGVADAASEVGDKAREASLRFGEATTDFVRNSLLQSQAFTDLFKTDNQDFADAILGSDLDFDKLIRETAKGGAEAGRAYTAEMLGGFDLDGLSFGDRLYTSNLQTNANRMVEIIAATTGETYNAATAMEVAGKEADTFANKSQAVTEVMDSLGEAAVESANNIANAYAQFVDPSSLITFTQDLEALRALEGEDRSEAATQWRQAWTDAYGGASFDIATYNEVFGKAAEEQATHIENINALISRGVPNDIIVDLAEMGPEAASLVAAMVDATDSELQEFVSLYGTTGFESMVALAAGQLAADQVVRNAAKTLSTSQLQQLSADLSAGTPLTDAMAKWNLDAQGNPMNAPVKEPRVPDISYSQYRAWQARNGINVPVRPYLKASNWSVTTNEGGGGGRILLYDQGGYTGPGGKYDPAGIVHRGEFVMTKEATSRIGVGNLYAMMNAAQSGRPAARPGGFAGGGFAGSGSNGPTDLSAATIQALASVIRPHLFIDGGMIADAADGHNAKVGALGGS